MAALTESELRQLVHISPSEDPARVLGCLAAANAYATRATAGRDLDAAGRLGVAYLAQGLIRDGYNPAIGEGWEQNGNVFARLTDVRIEQLLRVGRFAPPRVG